MAFTKLAQSELELLPLHVGVCHCDAADEPAGASVVLRYMSPPADNSKPGNVSVAALVAGLAAISVVLSCTVDEGEVAANLQTKSNSIPAACLPGFGLCTQLSSLVVVPGTCEVQGAGAKIQSDSTGVPLLTGGLGPSTAGFAALTTSLVVP